MQVGFAIKRQLVDADRDVLGVMQSVTMGAGVIPAAVAQEAACKQAAVVKRDSDDDQAIMYMRARYERVAGSPDNLSFHMINPNGSPGQELSIFFIRVWKEGSTPPCEIFLRTQTHACREDMILRCV